jgi:hypothetical protein
MLRNPNHMVKRMPRTIRCRNCSLWILLLVFSTVATAQNSADRGPSSDARSFVRRHREAELVADRWLDLLDREAFDLAWNETTLFFRSKIDPQSWAEMAARITQTHQDRGPFAGRHLLRSSGSVNAPPGFPSGGFWAFYFGTKYEDGSRVFETVVVQLDSDDRFQVAGYYRRDD